VNIEDKLPEWLLGKDEKTINSCLAFKYGGIPKDVGIPDIDWGNKLWSPAKKDLLGQSAYDSLRGEIERYPKDVSILVLIYSGARRDLLKRLEKVLPEGSEIKTFGPISPRGEVQSTFSYKDYASGLKEYLEDRGLDLLDTKINNGYVCLRVKTSVPTIYYYFHLFKNKIRIGLGAEGLSKRKREVLRSWINKTGDPKLWQDNSAGCALHWEIPVDGYYKDTKDWFGFWKASHILFLKVQAESKDLLLELEDVA